MGGQDTPHAAVDSVLSSVVEDAVVGSSVIEAAVVVEADVVVEAVQASASVVVGDVIYSYVRSAFLNANRPPKQHPKNNPTSKYLAMGI